MLLIIYHMISQQFKEFKESMKLHSPNLHYLHTHSLHEYRTNPKDGYTFLYRCDYIFILSNSSSLPVYLYRTLIIEIVDEHGNSYELHLMLITYLTCFQQFKEFYTDKILVYRCLAGPVLPDLIFMRFFGQRFI